MGTLLVGTELSGWAILLWGEQRWWPVRVLNEAMADQVRGTLGRTQADRTSRLPGRKRRHTLTALSLVLGVVLGVTYSRLMVHDHRWLVYVLAAMGGSCLVFLVVVIPRLVWAFFRKVWYRIALRQNADKAAFLAGQAQHQLTEHGDDLAPEERTNDLAVIACLRSDYAGAARTLEPLVAEQPVGLEASNLLAALVETAQWDRLADLVHRVVAERDGWPEANLARAAFASPAGPITAALETLAKERHYPRVLNNLGVKASRAGEADRAAEDLSLALQQRPNYPTARAELGALEYRRGQLQKALTDTASAAALSSAGEALICSNLGGLLCQAGDLRTAERWLLRARNLDPRNVAVQVNLGNAYAVQGKYPEALESYLGAEHAGGSAEAFHNSALVRFALHEYELALDAGLLAQAKAPADGEVLNNLGCYLWQAQRFEEAEQCYEESATLQPGGVAEANLISAALAAGDLSGIQERLSRANAGTPSLVFSRGLAYLLTALQIDPKAGVTQGKLYEYNLGAADTEFRRVISAEDGPVTESWLNLGLVNYLARDYEQAGEAFVNAAKRAGEGTDLVYPTAICFLQAAVQTQESHGAGPSDPVVPGARELLRKAKPYLEKALEVRTVAESACFNLGVMQYLLGDYDKAIALLRRAAVSDAPPHVFNALAIAEARRAQELQREIATASLIGEQRRRQLALQVAKLLSSAIHYFREVLRVQPHSPIVHANIGLAFMLRNQREDVETAIHHWQLMRQVGGEWGQRAFDLFSKAMSSEDARKLRFQDIEMSFQPLPVADWITFVPPRLTGLKYMVEDLPDLPDWQFSAYHPQVKRALRCRARAEVLRERLQHLAV